MSLRLVFVNVSVFPNSLFIGDQWINENRMQILENPIYINPLVKKSVSIGVHLWPPPGIRDNTALTCLVSKQNDFEQNDS